MLFRHPAERLLSHALRQVARRRPGVFERLGPHRDAVFHVAPAEFPVAFQLRPSAAAGEVRVKRKADSAGAAATIEGPFGDLLGVFDGGVDADSAYFSRRVTIQGRTEAVVALHNALDAADLDYGDLFGGGAAGRAAGQALEALRRFVAPPDRPEEGQTA
jgi:predicted lipid carrier protein YhbT